VSETFLKALTGATGLSRRRAFEAIREGRVTLDGLTVRDPSASHDSGVIALDGQPLPVLGRGRKLVYLMLNKPAGIISSAADELGRQNVLDLVPGDLRAQGLHSVGRLDRDTTGLLLLTNDGDLTYRLTHPSHEVEKEYWLAAMPALDQQQIKTLASGVQVDGKVRRPASVKLLPPGLRLQIAVVIKEGRNRQIRRMVDAVGSRVTRLHRVREGPALLGDLPEGRVRALTAAELRLLMEAASAQNARQSSGTASK
jgi:23S rRNA pseudouridine2605 synthase